MNDKLMAQLKILLDYIDYIMIAAFAGILLASYYLYNQEKAFDIAPQGAVADIPWDDKFTALKEDETILATLTNLNPDIREDPKARRLVQVNMFDTQSIKEQLQVEEAVRDDFAQAEAAYKEGKVERAKQLAESILQRYPIHLKSQRLLQQIDEAEKLKASEAAATPTPTPEVPVIP